MLWTFLIGEAEYEVWGKTYSDALVELHKFAGTSESVLICVNITRAVKHKRTLNFLGGK